MFFGIDGHRADFHRPELSAGLADPHLSKEEASGAREFHKKVEQGN